MITLVRLRHLAAIAVGALAASGCATTAPRTGPPTIRPATQPEMRQVATALVPLLSAAGIWRGPRDGCAAAVGVLVESSINVGVALHDKCKLSLLFTEGALQDLDLIELQGALAHEIGHVQLGHLSARRARRAAERKERERLEEGAATTVGVAAAIPIVGPLIALGVAGTHAVVDTVKEGEFRGYDRGEEREADRFALTLLDAIPRHPARCRALVALLERLDRESSRPAWARWLSTHPSPTERLEVARSLCAN
jgi:hypothetical protein